MTRNSNFAEYAGEHEVRPYSSTSGAGFRASVETNFVFARSWNTKIRIAGNMVSMIRRKIEMWYNMKTDAGGTDEG